MSENSIKYSFKNDYSELAHPKVLQALSAIGTVQFEGYGLDNYSYEAAQLVKGKISDPSVDVHFISGGTHANLVVISSMLRPYEAVIAVESGHIFGHEAGAIEATGHRICTVKGNDGKLSADDVKKVVAAHEDEHMVKPRMVYISQASETGTIYTKDELSTISKYCRKNRLLLFLDGARLGTAVNSHMSDLTYAEISSLVDVFYIGGTKNGALFGEAIVIRNEELKADFRFHLKQKGALLAKGAAIGIQFDALLRDGLYDELALSADTMALELAKGIEKLGYELVYPAQTNMIIPLFPNEVTKKLHEMYSFHLWETFDEMTSVRLVTSWATPKSAVDEFLSDLAAI